MKVTAAVFVLVGTASLALAQRIEETITGWHMARATDVMAPEVQAREAEPQHIEETITGWADLPPRAAATLAAREPQHTEESILEWGPDGLPPVRRAPTNIARAPEPQHTEESITGWGPDDLPPLAARATNLVAREPQHLEETIDGWGIGGRKVAVTKKF